MYMDLLGPWGLVQSPKAEIIFDVLGFRTLVFLLR
jgi:hypothetical protein